MKKSVSFFTSMLMILLLSNCEELLSEVKDCLDSTAKNYAADATYDCDGADINKPDYAASSTAESCCIYSTDEQIAAAAALVEEANSDVFNNLGDVVETEIDSTFAESPGSEINEIINMGEPYGKYEEALVLDPTNKGAHFGIGFMEVTLASQDELLESTLNEWVACIDSLGWFDDEDSKEPESSESTMPRSNINNNGYKKGIPQSGKAFFTYDALRILDYLPIITSHNNVLGSALFSFDVEKQNDYYLNIPDLDAGHSQIMEFDLNDPWSFTGVKVPDDAESGDTLRVTLLVKDVLDNQWESHQNIIVEPFEEEPPTQSYVDELQSLIDELRRDKEHYKNQKKWLDKKSERQTGIIFIGFFIIIILLQTRFF